MNKRFALIALLLAALMLLSGCNLIGHDDELDGAQVVAKVETSQDTTEITKAEWEAYRDYLASYYQQYFQQNFGVDAAHGRRYRLLRRGCCRAAD